MHLVVRLIMGVLGAVAFVLSLDLFRGLSRAGSVYSIADGLDAGDFRYMVVAEVMLLIGSVIYVAGGVTENATLIAVGDGLFALLILVPITVLVRWRRRLL